MIHAWTNLEHADFQKHFKPGVNLDDDSDDLEDEEDLNAISKGGEACQRLKSEFEENNPALLNTLGEIRAAFGVNSNNFIETMQTHTVLDLLVTELMEPRAPEVYYHVLRTIKCFMRKYKRCFAQYLPVERVAHNLIGTIHRNEFMTISMLALRTFTMLFEDLPDPKKCEFHDEFPVEMINAITDAVFSTVIENKDHNQMVRWISRIVVSISQLLSFYCQYTRQTQDEALQIFQIMEKIYIFRPQYRYSRSGRKTGIVEQPVAQIHLGSHKYILRAFTSLIEKTFITQENLSEPLFQFFAGVLQDGSDAETKEACCELWKAAMENGIDCNNLNPEWILDVADNNESGSLSKATCELLIVYMQRSADVATWMIGNETNRPFANFINICGRFDGKMLCGQCLHNMFQFPARNMDILCNVDVLTSAVECLNLDTEYAVQMLDVIVDIFSYMVKEGRTTTCDYDEQKHYQTPADVDDLYFQWFEVLEGELVLEELEGSSDEEWVEVITAKADTIRALVNDMSSIFNPAPNVVH